ncbi:MAG: hypothetical protein K6F86_03860 [Lachnospiraceae bacterium]|nr:hypothetical protein [Lachnospiraceae bacterium]
MRQHWKRVLALLLCFAMVFSTNFSMNSKAVFADEADTTIEAVSEEAAGNENDVNEETVSSEDAAPEETV